MSDIVAVGSYDDVLGHGDIGGRDAIAIVDALNDSADSEVVFWIPEWLAEQKSLDSVDASEQVFLGFVERETEKAWNIVQRNERNAWVPKSQVDAFRRLADATLTTPQNRLDTWGEPA